MSDPIIDKKLTSSATEAEEWRAIPGHPAYRVSNLGRIQTCHLYGSRGKLTPAWKDKKCQKLPNGYLRTALRAGGKYINVYVHRCVLLAFVGEPAVGQECRHLDGDKDNNCLLNLCWGTALENARDKESHGTTPQGSRHGGYKLTAPLVAEIRGLLAAGATGTSLAKEFGLSNATISRVRLNQLWNDPQT